MSSCTTDNVKRTQLNPIMVSFLLYCKDKRGGEIEMTTLTKHMSVNHGKLFFVFFQLLFGSE